VCAYTERYRIPRVNRNDHCSQSCGIFATQPSDVPFKSMGFDGSIYVDTHVNFSRPRSLHYSVQGLFYFTHDTGVLFHYSTEHTEEVILWVKNGKLQPLLGWNVLSNTSDSHV
jgi:hypothetical protein